MTSTIKLYFNSRVNKEHNFALDLAGSSKGIETYLATLTSSTITGFQYIKHALSLSIKLNEEQTKLAMGSGAEDLNYVKIQNGIENPMYYFVLNKIWKSQNTIELVLSMDTINSFEFNVDYLISDKSLIHRQHKDRLSVAYGNQLIQKGLIPNSIAINDTRTFTSEYNFTNIQFCRYFNGRFYTGPDVLVSTSLTSKTYDSSTGLYTYIITFNEAVTGGLGRSYHAYGVGRIFRREIDLYSEGINAPLYKEEKGDIVESINQNWYLLYRNTTSQDATDIINTSPVECFLIPETPCHVKDTQTQYGYISTSNTDSGYYYSLLVSYHGESRTSSGRKSSDIKLLVNDELVESYFVRGKDVIGNATQIFYQFPVIHNVSGTSMEVSIYSYTITYDSNGNLLTYVMNLIKTYSNATIKIISDVDEVNLYKSNSAPTYSWATSYESNLYIPTYNTYISTDATIIGTINSIDSVDKTDSRNIKLINLPYCPDEFSVDNSGVFSFSANWVYDSNTGFMKSRNLSLKFSNSLLYDYSYTPFEEAFINELINEKSLDQKRDDTFESKLYHSDFYRPKFVYDSFSKVFALEQYNFANYDSSKEKQKGTYLWHAPFAKITFVMTRTINSKFLFKIDESYLAYSVEDYDGLVAVTRNNEEPLYNSSYINYIRAGYNYDKKTLARSVQANYMGLGLSLGTSLASLAGGVLTGNPVLSGVGVITTGLGIANQLTNLIRTTAEGEQSIQRKLEETSRQAVSVAGSDDIDLLEAYSNNRAKFVLYKISDRMKHAISDLFYYCGYKLDVQDIPNKSSRYWFNYVEADLVIIDSNNLTSEIEDDIKERFKNGVTFLHYRNNKFNFNQDKENWETSIIGYLGGK